MSGVDANGSDELPLFFDGRRLTGRVGDSVAAALFAAGVKTLRSSPRLHQPRGTFCWMGSCQECLVLLEGRRVLACQTRVSAGLHIHSVPETGSDG